MSTYATPDSLVETSWLAEHLNDSDIRIVESNEDILLYGTGHIPNAVHIDWRADLNDPVQRDYITPNAFAKLASRHGISPDTTVIFYGDKANWWAAYALWVFRLFRAREGQASQRRSVEMGRLKVALIHAKFRSSRRVSTRSRRRGWIARFALSKKTRWRRAKRREPLIDVRSSGEFKGRSLTCPNIRRRACFAADIFRARAASLEDRRQRRRHFQVGR